MRAEANLERAARAAGLTDPRPPLRDRLRQLRESHPAAYDRARSHYEQAVLPALADGPDPLGTWIEYARFLAELTAPGRLLAIDGTGLAAPAAGPLTGQLLLHVPDEAGAAVLVALEPAEPSPAQRATIDLLVNRKLGW